MSRSLAVMLAALTLAAARPAHADIQTTGPEVYPGKSEVSVHLGFQNAFGSYYGGGPPGGFRLTGDYNFRFYDAGTFTLWLNAGFALTVGGGCSPAIVPGNGYACGSYGGGDSIEPMAGVKMKFKTPIPLVPYARLDAFFGYLFNRYCSDSGFAVGGRAAGGAKYFLTKNIGVGLETGLTLGPAFYSGAPPDKCGVGYFYDSHSELYAAFDFLVGAEFAFNNF